MSHHDELDALLQLPFFTKTSIVRFCIADCIESFGFEVEPLSLEADWQHPGCEFTQINTPKRNVRIQFLPIEKYNKTYIVRSELVPLLHAIHWMANCKNTTTDRHFSSVQTLIAKTKHEFMSSPNVQAPIKRIRHHHHRD